LQIAQQTGAEMLDSPSWTWSLCLIVLATAVHSLGIVLMVDHVFCRAA